MSWVAAGTAAAIVVGSVIQSDSASSAANKQQAATNQAITQNNAQAALTRSDLAPFRQTGQLGIERLNQLLGLGDPMQGERDRAAAAAGIKKPTRADAESAHLASHIKTFGTGYTAGSDMAAKERQVEDIYNQMLSDYNAKVAKIAPDTATGGTPDSDFGSLTRKFTMEDFQNDPVTKASFDFGMSEGEKAVQRMFGARGLSRSGAAVKAATRFATDYTGTKAGESQQRFVSDKANLFNKLAAASGIGQAATTTTGSVGAGNAAQNAALLTAQGNANAAAGIARGNAYSGAANQISNNATQQYTLDRILTSNGGGSTGTASQPSYMIGDTPMNTSTVGTA